jgi:hypothetical protein
VLVTPGPDGRWDEITYTQLATQVDAACAGRTGGPGNRVLRGFNGWMTVAWLATVKPAWWR